MLKIIDKYLDINFELNRFKKLNKNWESNHLELLSKFKKRIDFKVE